MKNKITFILSSISSLVLLLFYFFRPSKHTEAAKFDQTEKKAEEKKVAELKEEVKDIQDNTYTDEEIEKKFN